MATHLMVDLETLAVTPKAVILTIGAVRFDPLHQGHTDEFYVRVSMDDQDQMGREIDPNTLEWWSKQDPEIMEEAFDERDRIPLSEAIEQFHKFAWGCDAFWSHGATFDLVMLEDVYRTFKKPLIWNYWQLRDTRTLFDLGFNPDLSKLEKHNALKDAINQANSVQNVMRQLAVLQNR